VSSAPAGTPAAPCGVSELVRQEDEMKPPRPMFIPGLVALGNTRWYRRRERRGS
jgi:hypothetical protein